MAIGPLNCGECGVEFQPTRAQWDKKHRGRVFCGRECLSAGNRKSSKAWWTANPLTNTVVRPIVNCAYCQKEFTATQNQHQKLVKQPDANVYCTRECVHEATRHTETRDRAIAWMKANPDVGGLHAARELGISYITLLNWRRAEGMPRKSFMYRTTQNCTHCGEEYWPSSAQWHQRERHKDQVCSEKCRCDAHSSRALGVPRHDLRKHGLYGLEAQQVKLLRRKIKEFINEGARV